MSIEYGEIEAPRRTRGWIAALVAGAVIVGVSALVLWLTILRPCAVAQEYRRPHPPVALPAAYYQAVEERIAQGVGLSVVQVRAGIREDPGEGLFGVATAQGVSPDSLYTIEIAAHQTASAQMVASGVWTQAQADMTTQFWQGRAAQSPAIAARFPWYLKIFGGRQAARSLHFLGLLAFVAFIVIHTILVLATGAGKNFALIFFWAGGRGL